MDMFCLTIPEFPESAFSRPDCCEHSSLFGKMLNSFFSFTGVIL